MQVRVAEGLVEVLREVFEVCWGETQDAAAIEMEAGQAGDQMDGGGEPRGGGVAGGGGGRRGGGDGGATVRGGWQRGGVDGRGSNHCGGETRKVVVAEPACEPRTPAALTFDRAPLPKTRGVLEARQGAEGAGTWWQVGLARGQV